MSDLVVYTQPYVPAYRVPLFGSLDTALRELGLRLLVISGRPEGIQAGRGDRTSGHAWHEEIPVRSVAVARWAITARKLPSEARSGAALVTELEALNATAWADSFRRRPTILWGHGKGFVNDPGRVSDYVESVLARRAAHTMTYSNAGRDHLIGKGGVPADKVTAIGNSTDTVSLRAQLRSVLAATPEKFNEPSALYIGGIDASKRIDYLLSAFQAAIAIRPDFRLTVVGKGADADAVAALAAEHVQLRYVPEARGESLARLAAEASAIWMPGRVGLVAVDALALGLPVHTTNFQFHAPEIEFLRDEEVRFLGPSPEMFAEQSLRLITSQPDHRTFREDIPTVEGVAQRMARVIAAELGLVIQ